jgi:colanic acid/amylovoran biosynthesis protein
MAVQTARSAYPQSQLTLLMDDTDLGFLQSRLCDVKVVKSFSARFRSRRGHWKADAIVIGVASSLISVLSYRWRRHVPCLVNAWHDLFFAYAEADIVLSCPGNILADTARLGLPFLISSWTIAFALLLGKPLYVLPQSIGPLPHRWERTIVRWLYSRARTVMVREPVSLRLAAEIGLDSAKVHLVADLAFACLPETNGEQQLLVDWLTGCPRPIVGVTVINRLISGLGGDAWDRYEQAMAGALLAFLREQGGCVVFFPQVVGPAANEDDRIASRRVASLMGAPQNVFVLEDWVPAHTLVAAYGVTDLFVATRMHSAIFAVSSHVPTLLIEYLHKARGLAELLGIEAWLLQVSELDEAMLTTALFALWNERAHVRRHLAETVPDLASQARAAGQYLVEG